MARRKPAPAIKAIGNEPLFTHPSKLVKATIERQWGEHAPQWEAKLERGETLADEEDQALDRALHCWDEIGWQEAHEWSAKQMAKFKARWESWCAKAEEQIKSAGRLTLEGEKFKAYSRGVWRAVGSRESAEWDDAQWAKFKSEWATYAHASKAKADAGQAQSFSETQYEWWGESAWQQCANRQIIRNGKAARKVLERIKGQLKPWPEKLLPEDYDFRGWVKQCGALKDKRAGRAILSLGVMYEYARESWRLRGLLVALNRESRSDEAVSLGQFDGLETNEAERVLGKCFPILLALATELAANTPFGKVSPERVEAALYWTVKDKTGKTVQLSRVESEFGRTIRFVPAVAPAYETFRAAATGQETLIDWWTEMHPEKSKKSKYPFEPRKRKWFQNHNKEDCEEVMLVRVNWKDFTNAALGEAFAKFARRYRPTEKFRELPQKTGAGTGKDSSLTKHLNALSAMRLRYARPTKYARCEFEKVKLAGKKFVRVERKNFQHKAKQGVRTFMDWFPFGEPPTHAVPFIEHD